MQSIVETLLEALPTPSYSVQEAVSDCLAPLMSGLATDKSYVQSLAQRLLTATLSGPDYPHRYIPVPFCCGIPAPFAAIIALLTNLLTDLLTHFDIDSAYVIGCYLCFSADATNKFTLRYDVCCAPLKTMSWQVLRRPISKLCHQQFNRLYLSYT